MAGPLTIYLIRHGQVHNPQQILYGRLPGFRLSENGRQQAQLAGRYLSVHPMQAIFSSPMLRARQTAQEIIKYQSHIKLGISTMLNEVFTSHEGRPGAEVDALNGDIYTGTKACYEQPEDIVARTRKFVLRMRRHNAGGRVAAVTHGDIITFMILWVKGFDLTPLNKTRLLQAGFPASYPAHASLTALVYQTTCAQEKPIIQYVDL